MRHAQRETPIPVLMEHRVIQPPPEMAEHIGFIWYYSGLNLAHTMERVLPDGSVQLLINLKGGPRKLFAKNDQTRWSSFRDAWFSGPQTEFLVIDVLQGASMMGVHFKPAGVIPFLGMPATEIAGRVIDLEAIWGSEGIELHQQLLEAPGPDAKFRQMIAFLKKRFALHFNKKLRSTSVVAYAIQAFTAAPHEVTIREVTNQIGLTHRRFIEVFREEVGMTPKRFCRLQRFQRAIREIEQQRCLDWADLSAACGFFDQSHFIHEFKAFSGMNPSVYLVEKGDYLNFVPIQC